MQTGFTPSSLYPSLHGQEFKNGLKYLNKSNPVSLFKSQGLLHSLTPLPKQLNLQLWWHPRQFGYVNSFSMKGSTQPQIGGGSL